MESDFQADLIKVLRRLFPGCIVLKNDANYLQGVPDLLILWLNRWAALEVKKSPKSDVRPNQLHYIRQMDRMSFAAVINPENKDSVLGDLQRAFGTQRDARIPEPK